MLAVPHRAYTALPQSELVRMVKPTGVIIDVRGMLDRTRMPATMQYYSL